MEFQVITLLVAIAGPLAVIFGLGARIGRMEAKLDGHRELLEAQIRGLARQRDDCEERHNQVSQDHEGRLRKLEGTADG